MRSPYWNAAKAATRRYEGRGGGKAHDLTEHERQAVQAAVEAAEALAEGESRLKLIDLVFWKRTNTLTGAALALHISERTARRWHTAFIRSVARNLRGENNDQR